MGEKSCTIFEKFLCTNTKKLCKMAFFKEIHVLRKSKIVQFDEIFGKIHKNFVFVHNFYTKILRKKSATNVEISTFSGLRAQKHNFFSNNPKSKYILLYIIDI